MDESTITADAQAAASTTEGAIASVEKVTNLLGLTDLTADLDNLAKGIESVMAQASTLTASLGAQVDTIKSLFASVKTHLEAISPAAEISAAKAKVEEVVTRLETLFKGA